MRRTLAPKANPCKQQQPGWTNSFADFLSQSSCTSSRGDIFSLSWGQQYARRLESWRLEQPPIICKATDFLSSLTRHRWICWPPLPRTNPLIRSTISKRAAWPTTPVCRQPLVILPSFYVWKAGTYTCWYHVQHKPTCWVVPCRVCLTTESKSEECLWPSEGTDSSAAREAEDLWWQSPRNTICCKW